MVITPQRVTNPQSPPAPRNTEARGTNHLDSSKVVNSAFSGADVALAEGGTGVAWSTADEVLPILGYDYVTLFVDYTKGTDTGGVYVAVQIAEAPFSQAGAADAAWSDVYVEDATGVARRKVFDVPMSDTGRAALRFEVPGGRLMRFKVWGQGGDGTNARVTLRARPGMSSI